MDKRLSYMIFAVVILSINGCSGGGNGDSSPVPEMMSYPIDYMTSSQVSVFERTVRMSLNEFSSRTGRNLTEIKNNLSSRINKSYRDTSNLPCSVTRCIDQPTRLNEWHPLAVNYLITCHDNYLGIEDDLIGVGSVTFSGNTTIYPCEARISNINPADYVCSKAQSDTPLAECIPDALFNGGGLRANENTINRVCYIAGYQSYTRWPDSGDWDSPDDNRLIFWNGRTWIIDAGNNANHVKGTISCKTSCFNLTKALRFVYVQTRY
jgi:hypothetical protein